MTQDKPNAARIYAYLLGDDHYRPIDKMAAERMLQISPNAATSARANRAFLSRATRFLLNQGIRQFIDLGSGLPTAGHIHQTAHAVGQNVSVVYVDHDPDVVAYANQLLAQENTPYVVMIEADLTDIEAIFTHSQTQALIDLSKPVAVSLISVLHFITDDAVVQAVTDYLYKTVVPQSYLVLTHGTPGQVADQKEQSDQVKKLYQRTTTPLRLRTPEECQALFGRFQLVEPGIVLCSDWRPALDKSGETWQTAGILAGVGQKR